MIIKLLTEHHLEFISLKEAAEARPSQHLSKCQIVGILMPRLKSSLHSLTCCLVPQWLLPLRPHSRLMIFFFQNQQVQNIISGKLLQCQTVWIQIRADVLSFLIWVQTVCKGYQQTAKVTISKKIVEAPPSIVAQW